jgi:hypothetical protein
MEGAQQTNTNPQNFRRFNPFPLEYEVGVLSYHPTFNFDLLKNMSRQDVPEKKHDNHVRFQVLTAASMMFRVVFWDILSCKMIADRRFRGAYCLHHHPCLLGYTVV